MRSLVSFKSLLLILGLLSAWGCAPKADIETAATCPPGNRVAMDRIDGQGRTGITGTVRIKEDGQALDGAFINVYPDTISNLLGPSQFISAPTGNDGSYRVEVPPGSYYVVARKRMTGDSTGPLSTGDFYSEHQRVFTRVDQGKFSVVDLDVVPMKAPMFFKKNVVERETDTAISGRLMDTQGRPVAGGFAMAYRQADMKRQPDFASTLSDREGRFTLYLPEGGTFYLAARIHAWDMPQPGEPYGVVGRDTPRPLTLSKGETLPDVVIRMAPFAGSYKEGKSRRPM